ncbi:uncharacterized protein LOC116959136 isoform X2 [Tyto alba]|uniref:uncharacterized protein LOC116959136 isoform X2 n=1 Tax=Tyto alba TaxID=56313 RepID=UPI001C667986|nr:uncharacterized protein LOC116959136 isoform X2 [Tyto alba]
MRGEVAAAGAEVLKGLLEGLGSAGRGRAQSVSPGSEGTPARSFLPCSGPSAWRELLLFAGSVGRAIRVGAAPGAPEPPRPLCAPALGVAPPRITRGTSGVTDTSVSRCGTVLARAVLGRDGLWQEHPGTGTSLPSLGRPCGALLFPVLSASTAQVSAWPQHDGPAALLLLPVRACSVPLAPGTACSRQSRVPHARNRVLCRGGSGGSQLGALVSRRHPELLRCDCVEVTWRGRKRRRDLLLFQGALAFAKRRCGTRFWLQHRVRLSELWVLCQEEEACACAQEDAALGLDCSCTLILVWPTSLCGVTFGSQEVKELWLDAILRQSSTAQGTRVTTLPSLNLLVSVLGLCRTPVTMTAQIIETLVQCQAKAQRHREEDCSRALAKQQESPSSKRTQMQLEPKVPEPEDSSEHADVQTGRML